MAELLALSSGDSVLRFGCLALTFLFLIVAACLFVPTAPSVSIAVFVLAYFVVGFVVYFWFLVEKRKRSIQLKLSVPNGHDAEIADLRNTVYFACAQLFLITPLLLQSFNGALLHFIVEPDLLGVRSLACEGNSVAMVCQLAERAAEFPAWFGYTLLSLVKFAPVGDELHTSVLSMTGVTPSPSTPAFVDLGMKTVFGTFLVTLVVGQVKKIEGRINEAIELLRVSPEFAAGMGPIMLPALQFVVSSSEDAVVREHAVKAVSNIARHYQYEITLNEVRDRFETLLIDQFDDVEVKDRANKSGDVLAVRAEVLCRISSVDGKEVVFSRIALSNDWVSVKRSLVRAAYDCLARDEAKVFFGRLSEQNLKGYVAKDVEYFCKMLDDEVLEDAE